MFATFYWDPPKDAFTVPFIDHPVAWYGILFALGFFVSYLIVRKIFTEKLSDLPLATLLTDKLTLYIVIGTIVGARLVEVFFYAWPYYKMHPMAILRVWEGGLASHGGALGVILAICLFSFRIKKLAPALTIFFVLDAISIGVAFTGTLIRIGNFINQEILGKVSHLPWAVIFGHPVDDPTIIPRHPVQLYEAFFYFAIFLFLFTLWKKNVVTFGRGIYIGWTLVLIFTFRFFIEWLKLPQSDIINEASFLTMGQYLSIPFILVGLYLLFRPKLAIHA